MNIVDVGSGAPLVLVPGIQGRWEWMMPGVNALARECRVITFSLADEPAAATTFDAQHGFDSYVEQVRDALDQSGLDEATICGVSYGGLIAAAFAGRYPERVTALVLASALPPGWKPDRRVLFYLRAPRLLSPLFCVASLRFYREIAAAAPGVLPGVSVGLRAGVTAIRHMFSPWRMARRVELSQQVDVQAELASVQAPTLVITGDEALDVVVPVARTREYLDLLPHAQSATLHGTGHLGLITKPVEFARLVASFMRSAAAATSDARRRIG